MYVCVRVRGHVCGHYASNRAQTKSLNFYLNRFAVRSDLKVHKLKILYDDFMSVVEEF